MPVSAVAALPQTDPAPLPSLVAAAKAQLAREIDGNGLSAAQIRIAREESGSHCLLGELGAGFELKLQREPKAGVHTAGTVVADETAAYAAAEAAARDFCHTPAAAALLAKVMQDDEAQGWGLRDTEMDAGAEEQIYSFTGDCVCAGTDNKNCTACEGSGKITQIFRGRMRAKISFWQRRQDMNPTALAAADRIGIRELATKNEADIFIMPPVVRSNRLVCDACAWLAVAKLDLSLEGRFVPAIVAGRSAHIVELPPILDRWLKPGISALLKLSRGSLAVDPLIDTALKFRLVRQTLQGVMKRSRKQVYLGLRKAYPMTVSDNYRKAAVKYAMAALTALARQARMRAARQSAILGAAVMGIWFFTAARSTTESVLMPVAPVWVADAALFFLLALGAAGWIHHRAKRHIMDVTGSNAPPAHVPATGRETAGAIFCMGVTGFAMGVFALPAPVWAQPLADILHPLLAQFTSM